MAEPEDMAEPKEIICDSYPDLLALIARYGEGPHNVNVNYVRGMDGSEIWVSGKGGMNVRIKCSDDCLFDSFIKKMCEAGIASQHKHGAIINQFEVAEYIKRQRIASDQATRDKEIEDERAIEQKKQERKTRWYRAAVWVIGLVLAIPSFGWNVYQLINAGKQSDAIGELKKEIDGLKRAIQPATQAATQPATKP